MSKTELLIFTNEFKRKRQEEQEFKDKSALMFEALIVAHMFLAWLIAMTKWVI